MAKNELDNELERDLFMKIRVLEGENLKTKKYDDRKMVNTIMNLIKKNVDAKEGADNEI